MILHKFLVPKQSDVQVKTEATAWAFPPQKSRSRCSIDMEYMDVLMWFGLLLCVWRGVAMRMLHLLVVASITYKHISTMEKPHCSCTMLEDMESPSFPVNRGFSLSWQRSALTGLSHSFGHCLHGRTIITLTPPISLMMHIPVLCPHSPIRIVVNNIVIFWYFFA